MALPEFQSPHWCLEVNLADFKLQVVVKGQI
jgi:hypothetical protein